MAISLLHFDVWCERVIRRMNVFFAGRFGSLWPSFVYPFREYVFHCRLCGVIYIRWPWPHMHGTSLQTPLPTTHYLPLATFVSFSMHSHKRTERNDLKTILTCCQLSFAGSFAPIRWKCLPLLLSIRWDFLICAKQFESRSVCAVCLVCIKSYTLSATCGSNCGENATHRHGVNWGTFGRWKCVNFDSYCASAAKMFDYFVRRKVDYAAAAAATSVASASAM